MTAVLARLCTGVLAQRFVIVLYHYCTALESVCVIITTRRLLTVDILTLYMLTLMVPVGQVMYSVFRGN